MGGWGICVPRAKHGKVPHFLIILILFLGDYWSERITNTSLTPSGRNTSESPDSTKLKSSSSTESADSKSQKSSSSGEKRGRANNKPQQPQAPQRFVVKSQNANIL